MYEDCKVKRATIPNGQALSNIIDLENGQMATIHMPAEWTPANLTFNTAPTASGPFQPHFDDGGFEVVVTVTAGRNCGIDLNALKLASVRYLQVRSGTSASPVNQAAERTLWIVTKR